MTKTRLLFAAYQETWAISQLWLARLVTTGAAEDAEGAAKLPTVKGDVAILPLHGPISQRASIWQEIFGGTSTEQFGAAYSRAVNEPRLGAVVINVDSPGGTTAGVQELADLVYRGSQIKPTYAVANSQAASAAYWIASQVGKGNFFAAPGSDVGSIGVFRMHEDMSAAMEKEGVAVTFISVPEYKTEGNPYEPLGEAAIQHHASQVRETYGQFVKAVARGRGVPVSRVKSDFGRGRMFHAAQAAELGMVDRVATLTEVTRKLTGKSGNAMTSASLIDVKRGITDAWTSGAIEPLREPVRLDAKKDRLAYLTRLW